MSLPLVSFTYSICKKVSDLICKNVLQNYSIKHILVGSVCVQMKVLKANDVEVRFIRSLDSNLSLRSYVRCLSSGSRNSSVGRALD